MKDYLFAAGLTFFVIVICPIVWWTWDHVKNYVKEGWKERFGLILILILLSSCSSQEELKWRKVTLPMTVTETKGDSATLKTDHFAISYFASSKDRVVGEQKYIIGLAYPSDMPGEYYLKIKKAIPVTDTAAIRRALKVERYLNL